MQSCSIISTTSAELVACHSEYATLRVRAQVQDNTKAADTSCPTFCACSSQMCLERSPSPWREPSLTLSWLDRYHSTDDTHHPPGQHCKNEEVASTICQKQWQHGEYKCPGRQGKYRCKQSPRSRAEVLLQSSLLHTAHIKSSA